ncbi:hypothetical protein HYH02_015428, partial [Chlamydomonas schloesseri]
LQRAPVAGGPQAHTQPQQQLPPPAASPLGAWRPGTASGDGAHGSPASSSGFATLGTKPGAPAPVASVSVAQGGSGARGGGGGGGVDVIWRDKDPRVLLKELTDAVMLYGGVRVLELNEPKFIKRLQWPQVLECLLLSGSPPARVLISQLSSVREGERPLVAAALQLLRSARHTAAADTADAALGGIGGDSMIGVLGGAGGGGGVDIVTDMDEELEERVMRFHEERDMAELGRALGNTLHHWLAGTTPVPEGPRQLVLDLQRLGLMCAQLSELLEAAGLPHPTARSVKHPYDCAAVVTLLDVSGNALTDRIAADLLLLALTSRTVRRIRAVGVQMSAAACALLAVVPGAGPGQCG